MFEEPIVFVDIETNGGRVGSGRITEVAVIRVEDDIVVDSFSSLINPGSPIPGWITSLTGITDADVVQAPYFEDIAGQLWQLMQGAIFGAHNVSFDYSFVKHHFGMVGYDFHPKKFCTVKLSRALYPENHGHSLEKIIARHNISVDARHRAYADTKAILDFTKLAFAEKGGDKFKAACERQWRSLRTQ